LLEERRLLATITVTSLADNSLVNGQVTLREAIRAAELNISVDGSTAGSGADTIQFAPGLSGPVNLSIVGDSVNGPAAFAITTLVTIRGNANGITLQRAAGAPEMRLIGVGPTGNLTLESIMLAGGLARGADGTDPAPTGADGRGGAILSFGTLSITASTLYSHSAIGGDGAAGGAGGAGLGGAIYNHGGSATIVNSTISENSVESGAGTTAGFRFAAGVYSRNGTLTISNSTLTNHAATAGRGVYVIGDGASASVVIRSTIVGQADAGASISELLVTEDNGGTATSSGDGNIIRRSANFNGTIVSTDDPQLGPLGANGGPTWTHALVGDSPAVDQGINPLSLSVDQRGSAFVRVAAGVPDIGAFERQTVGGPALAGDYNGNLAVDAADFVVWRNTMGAIVSPFSGADGNGDGQIDAADYGVWRANFGKTAATATVFAVAVVADLPVVDSAFDAATTAPSPAPSSEPAMQLRLNAADNIGRDARPARNLQAVPIFHGRQLELALIDALAAERRFSGPADTRPGVLGPCEGAPVPRVIDELLADWPAVL
jgi:hypothetical protein